MRTNFKLIVSTGSGGHGCPKTASVACNIPESGPQQQQQCPVSVPVPVPVPVAAPTSASAWHWFSNRHWPGRPGTLRNRPFAAVKENDCNYASLFLNFHAVHLPRLPLAAAEAEAAAHHFGLGICGGFGHWTWPTRQASILLLLLLLRRPFVRNKYVPESFRKLLVACMFPKSGSKTFCVSFVCFVFLFSLSFASLNEKSNLKDTTF